MLAAVLRELGRLEITELVDPQPLHGEVLIRVTACGICHTDLHVIKGEVPFPLPAVLGHEVSGSVVGIGPGVKDLEEGDQVVTSFIMPCGWCEACVKGRDDLCDTFFKRNRLKGTLLDGSTRLASPNGEPVWMYSMGGLAEFAVSPATAVYRLPEGLDTASAALLGCSGLTALGALDEGGLRAGMTVAVVAVGGVGLNVVQLASSLGAARVLAIDLHDDKLRRAEQLGATDTFNASRGDLVERVLDETSGKGVDLVVEAFGSPNTVATALALVRDGGRVVLVGIAPVGVMAEFEITKLVRRKIQVVGSFGARPRIDMPRLLSLAAVGRIDMAPLVSERVSLDGVDDAYQRLSQGQIVGRSLVAM
jgi:succinate semialdehyde reductase (NADPH)